VVILERRWSVIRDQLAGLVGFRAAESRFLRGNINSAALLRSSRIRGYFLGSPLRLAVAELFFKGLRDRFAVARKRGSRREPGPGALKAAAPPSAAHPLPDPREQCRGSRFVRGQVSQA
jgi:hypothetical protein